jgi:hypothetical protein
MDKKKVTSPKTLGALLCVLIVGWINFGFKGSFKRELINYDDLNFITPILKFGLTDYFTQWLFNPHGTAHPLRDFTWMWDGWILKTTGFPSFWVTETLMFLWLGYWVWQLLVLYLEDSKPLAFCLLLYFLTHPTGVEVVQWASARRNLMPLLFLFPASIFLLRSEKEGTELRLKDWGFVIGLWLLSLLSYPVGMAWPLWVLWLKRHELKSNFPLAVKVVGGFGVAFVLNSIWKVQTDVSWKLSVTALFNPEVWDREFYHGWKSVGRGIWNIVSPFQLAIYYNENSILSFLGAVLGGAIAVAGFRFYRSRLDSSEKTDWQNLLFLGVTLFLPQALIFTTYLDYVWADRYTLAIFPSMLVLLGLYFRKTLITPQYRMAAFFVFVILTLAQTLYAAHRAPLWKSFTPLVNDCSAHEGSAECLIRSISIDFEWEGCSPKKKYFDKAHELWKSHSLQYAFRFKRELPFYDALCIALNAKMKPEEKLEAIPKLIDTYEGRGEIIPAMTLVHLQNKQWSQAYDSAAKYSLTQEPWRTDTTVGVSTFLRGQARALCEILKKEENSLAQDCERRRAILEDFTSLDYSDEAALKWAYTITKVMADLGAAQ